eukprot:TRINITY_DN3688_c0_g1_i4.p1 TRINITY_DN3688_c0_g1~~TRINITY_DN3688_c0_g1_i4.p1  ORF type:complete len:234 (-),score=6.75 TRINITY_DN3688_c0_g1_i4:30-731(-)
MAFLLNSSFPEQAQMEDSVPQKVSPSPNTWKVFEEAPISVHGISCFIGHHQLANQICCLYDDPDCAEFFVSNLAVKRYNYRSGEETTELSTGWGVTNIAVGFGFLAAVGSQGELLVKDLATNEIVFDRRTSHRLINNAVLFAEICGEPKLLLSSNNYTIKIFSAMDWKREPEVLHCEEPINGAFVTPDRKTLVGVGDSPNIHFWDDRLRGCRISGRVTESEIPLPRTMVYLLI